MKDRKTWVLLMLLSIPLGFGARDFWAPDEPRFAEVSQEMLESGDWVVPHFNGNDLALLPPMTYWTSAAASLPAGHVTETTARLPIFLFAMLAVAATFVLGRGEVGLVAALIVASSAKFLHQSQFLQSDMILIGCQVWALAAFYRGYVSERRTGWYLSAYVAVALGFLTKGPLALLLPGAIVFFFLLWQRDLRHTLRAGLWWGIPLIALIVLPWYLAAASRTGPEFRHELIWTQNLGMFFGKVSHQRPVYYYLLQLPWMFLPWTPFLPAAFRALRIDREKRFLLTWAVFCLVFFSASNAKQAKYILAIIPPLAIFVSRWFHERYSVRLARWVYGVLAALCGGAAVVAPFFLPPEGRAFVVPLLVAGLLVSGFMGAASFFARRRFVGVSLAAGAMLCGMLLVQETVIPKVNHVKSARDLAELARDADEIAVYGIPYLSIGGLRFYGGRPIRDLQYDHDAYETFMHGPGKRVCFVRTNEWPGDYTVIGESRYRSGTVLVANRP